MNSDHQDNVNSDNDIKTSIGIYDSCVSAIAAGPKGVGDAYGFNSLAPYELRMDLMDGVEIAKYDVISNEERFAIFEIIDLLRSGIFDRDNNLSIEDLESKAWAMVREKAIEYLKVRRKGFKVDR